MAACVNSIILKKVERCIFKYGLRFLSALPNKLDLKIIQSVYFQNHTSMLNFMRK